jgi:hypothetical protein
MLYRGIIAVYSETHTKHINRVWGQNVEFLNHKPGGTYSDHWAEKGDLGHNCMEMENAVLTWKSGNVCPFLRPSRMSA